MMNNNERKRVIIRDPYSNEGSHYMMTDDQIRAIRKMQSDGFIDEDTIITVVDDTETWDVV